MWKIIVIILLFASPAYGAKKEPIIIDTQVLQEHQKLYQSYAIEVTNVDELPILPQIWFDMKTYRKYIWGQQRTLLELLK